MVLLIIITVMGSSKAASISACRRNTLPRHARHSILSKAGKRSRRITPATNLCTPAREKLNYNQIARAVFLRNEGKSTDSCGDIVLGKTIRLEIFYNLVQRNE